MPALPTRKVWGVLGSLVLVFAAAACGGGGGSAGTANEKLVVNYGLPPANLDPIQDCSLQDNGFKSSMYVMLTQHPLIAGPNGTQQTDPGKAVPYLAKSWDVSTDGLTYTFHLRTDAKFPDGKPVDAAAVKYSAERALNNTAACGAYFWNAGGTTTITSIDTPDPGTVVIHLKNPTNLLLLSYTEPSTGVVEPSLLDANGGSSAAGNQWLATHDAGSGPYLLKSYSPGVHAVFVANPTYFGPKPYAHEVDVNITTSDPTLLLQARSGAADVTVGMSDSSVASLKGNGCCRIIANPSAQWELVALPNQYRPFDNKTLREALTYAVPYSDIISKVTHGYGQAYYGPFPPAFPAYDPSIGAARTYDINKAKQLIGQSGVQLPVSLKMVVRDGDSDGQQIATIVQSTWKDLGINVTIQQLSAAAYDDAAYAKLKTYSVVREDGPSVEDPLWLLSYDMECASLFNTANYCNPTADGLVNQAATTTDPTGRQALWNRIATMWVADSPRIPVYALVIPTVLKSNITHYVYDQEGFKIQYWGR